MLLLWRFQVEEWLFAKQYSNLQEQMTEVLRARLVKPITLMRMAYESHTLISIVLY